MDSFLHCLKRCLGWLFFYFHVASQRLIMLLFRLINITRLCLGIDFLAFLRIRHVILIYRFRFSGIHGNILFFLFLFLVLMNIKYVNHFSDYIYTFSNLLKSCSFVFYFKILLTPVYCAFTVFYFFLFYFQKWKLPLNCSCYELYFFKHFFFSSFSTFLITTSSWWALVLNHIFSKLLYICFGLLVYKDK